MGWCGSEVGLFRCRSGGYCFWLIVGYHCVIGDMFNFFNDGGHLCV